LDPERALTEILELAHELLDLDDEECCGARRLAELVIGLHEWLSKGGFPPSPWSPGKKS
jgi:hypothetical protein